MSQADLSLIIPTLCRSESVNPSLLTLLDSIRHQDSGGATIETLVIANPPAPRLRALIEARGVRYLQTEEEGANRARNKGVRHSNGEILLFLDDDCRLSDPSFLRKHLDWHRRIPNAAAIGGEYELRPGSSALARTYHRHQMEWLRSGCHARAEFTRTTHLLGGNLSFKRGFLEGFEFDEKLLYGGTETELLARMTARGLPFFLIEDLKTTHDSSLSWSSLLRKAYSQGQGKAYIQNSSLIAERRMNRAWGAEKDSLSLTDRVASRLFRKAFQLGFEAGNGRLVRLKSERLLLGSVILRTTGEMLHPQSWLWIRVLVSCLRASLRVSADVKNSHPLRQKKTPS